jgi:IMP cyclohydrolase
VKYENKSGIAAISNGIQTEAIFEMYRLLVNTAALAGKDYLEKIMEGAGAEPDSYHTPRIAGVITAQGENATPVFIMGMKGYGQPARTFRIEFRPGTMLCISTYKGDMDKPEARDPRIALPEVDWSGKTAEELADFVFEMSAASYQGKDIRVCVVSGVLSGSKTWKLAIK